MLKIKLFDWAHNKAMNYQEPQRKGSIRGQRLTSRKKYLAGLFMLSRMEQKSIAEFVKVEYQTLRNWRQDPAFLDMVAQHRKEFVREFFAEFKGLFESDDQLPIEELLQELSVWSKELLEEMIDFISTLRVDRKEMQQLSNMGLDRLHEMAAEQSVCFVLCFYICAVCGGDRGWLSQLIPQMEEYALAVLSIELDQAAGLLVSGEEGRVKAGVELVKQAKSQLSQLIQTRAMRKAELGPEFKLKPTTATLQTG